MEQYEKEDEPGRVRRGASSPEAVRDLLWVRRADVHRATASHRGGHQPMQKLYAGNGREVIVPGHVRAQLNHKQWNLESVVAALKQKGVAVDKTECIIIDSDEEDVTWLRAAGYRALFYNKEEGIRNLLQNQM